MDTTLQPLVNIALESRIKDLEAALEGAVTALEKLTDGLGRLAADHKRLSDGHAVLVERVTRTLEVNELWDGS